MRIAVAGGTGTAGRCVIQAAERAGHEAVSLSRKSGVDLVTGAGLRDALRGVEVVIDTTNTPAQSRAKATAFFTQAARRLQSESAAGGVRRLVVLSIVSLERVPYGYYQAKLAQEAAANEGPLPVTIVRATQFHEFAGQMLQRARRGPVALLPAMRVQPVSAGSVGEVLVEVATAEAPPARLDIAGPEVKELIQLARALLRHQGARVVVLPLPVPGAAGKAMRSGAQLPTDDVRVVGPTFQEWLTSH